MADAVPGVARSTRGWALIPLVILLLAGLPLAVWLDLRNLSERSLSLQASDINPLITTSILNVNPSRRVSEDGRIMGLDPHRADKRPPLLSRT